MWGVLDESVRRLVPENVDVLESKWPALFDGPELLQMQ